MSKILAIDPGPTKSAWVAWDTEKDAFCEAEGALRIAWQMGIADNVHLCGLLESVISLHDIERVCFEFPQNYGHNIGASILHTCRAVGQLEISARRAKPGVHLELYGRPTIKGQVGGKNDTEIRASLRMRYGDAKKGHKLEGVKKDIWAALALACALTENPNLKRVEYLQ